MIKENMSIKIIWIISVIPSGKKDYFWMTFQISNGQKISFSLCQCRQPDCKRLAAYFTNKKLQNIFGLR